MFVGRNEDEAHVIKHDENYGSCKVVFNQFIPKALWEVKDPSI